jgi:hypothetical protein
MLLAAALMLGGTALAEDSGEAGKPAKTKASKAAKAEKCWPRYQVGNRLYEDRSYTSSSGVLHIVLVEVFPTACPATVLGAAAK